MTDTPDDETTIRPTGWDGDPDDRLPWVAICHRTMSARRTRRYGSDPLTSTA